MTDMTPEAINRRIAEWAGLCWHERAFHFYVKENKVFCRKCKQWIPIVSGVDYAPRNPDYFRSNAAMDLMVVMVAKNYIPSMEYLEHMREWEVAIFRSGDNESVLSVARHKELPGTICTAILELIEREGR